MTLTDLLREQLLDPFRIALLAALVFTMLRTEAVTGRWVPLAAGVVFVAVIIPMTTTPVEGERLGQAVASGIVANLAILAVVLGLLEAWRRLRR